MAPQVRVGGVQDVGDQLQLLRGRIYGREHEVADAQVGEPHDRLHGGVGPQHQQEDLADVVVALEVVQVAIPPQHLEDEIRELLLHPFLLVCIRICTALRVSCMMRVRVASRHSGREGGMCGGGIDSAKTYAGDSTQRARSTSFSTWSSCRMGGELFPGRHRDLGRRRLERRGEWALQEDQQLL